MKAETAHEKAYIFQNILLEKLNDFLPEKIVNFTSEDQVWVTPEIKDIARKKSREFFKHRKSPKWNTLIGTPSMMFLKKSAQLQRRLTILT